MNQDVLEEEFKYESMRLEMCVLEWSLTCFPYWALSRVVVGQTNLHVVLTYVEYFKYTTVLYVVTY